MRIDFDRLRAASHPCPPRPEWIAGRDWATQPRDASMLHEAMLMLRPKRVVESGTFTGVGTTIMASALNANGQHANLHTVDYGQDKNIIDSEWRYLGVIRDTMLRQAQYFCPNVTVHFHEGLTKDKLPEVLVKLEGHQWDFWFQDSGHCPDEITEEINIMMPAAAPEAVMVLDDIIPNHQYRNYAPEGWDVRWINECHGQLWLQKKN